MKNDFAVVFDMDGVLVDNNKQHMEAFFVFGKKYNLNITEQLFKESIFGRTNFEIMNFLFKKNLSPKEHLELAFEKEAMYRTIFTKEITPPKGLKEWLTILEKANIPMAIGTSGPTENVDFVLDTLAIRHYFKVIVDNSQVKKGKPDPEIYIKVAQNLGIETNRCIVFEDSPSGIESARLAGMKIIGITTTHEEKDLHGITFSVPNFEGLTIEKVKSVLS